MFARVVPKASRLLFWTQNAFHLLAENTGRYLQKSVNNTSSSPPRLQLTEMFAARFKDKDE